MLHANVPNLAAGWFNTTTPADTGWSNQIVYTTPSFGGLTANIHYQFGEQSTSGNKGKKNIGVNALYFNGPLSLTAFYERDQISNPGAGGLLPGGVTKSDWMLGGSYNFNVVKLYATYGQSKVKDVDAKNKTYSLGLDVPVTGTPGTFKAAMAQTKAEQGGASAKRTTATLGYDHFLSKRTDVYGALMYDRISYADPKTGTSLVVGIRHRF